MARDQWEILVEFAAAVVEQQERAAAGRPALVLPAGMTLAEVARSRLLPE
jgi:hypothetical protein